eukprot:gene16554-30270_t
MPRDVDETLFATKPRTKKNVSARSNGTSGLEAASSLSGFYSGGGSANQQTRRTRGAETLRLVTKDQIRTLKVPNKTSQPGNLVISWTDYCRLKDAASKKTAEDNYQAELAHETALDERQAASQARRKEFEAIDVTRAKTRAPTDMDLETARKETSMLSNARELLAEDDDEIKKLNELILEAKVHAVRDAQVAEKAAIKQAHQQHDYRLDMMMEEERVRGLLETERIEVALKEEHMQGRRELEAQIAEREQTQLLNGEIREQEQKAMLEKLELLHLEDYEAAQQKRDEARALMADVQRANEEAIRIRQARDAATMLEEQKMAEFLESKALREQELEEEGLRKKALREREQARMIESQDLAASLQGDRDALAERRAHAARERAARAQAIVDAQKKEVAQVELLAGLETQIVSHAHERARAAEMDYKEFQLNILALEDVIESEKVKEEESHQRRIANKEGVVEQIKEKERAAIKERVGFFTEGSSLDVEARERAMRLQEIKDKKLAALEATGIDTAHITQVKRAVEINARRAMKVSGPVV